MLNAKHGMIAKLAGLTLAGGLVVAGAVASPAAADEPKTKEIRTVVIEHDGTGQGTATWNGKDLKADCPGTMTVIEAGPTGTEQKKEQQKIVLCTKGGTKEELAKGLERALENVTKNDEMSEAAKSELSAKLKAKIAEVRAGN